MNKFAVDQRFMHYIDNFWRTTGKKAQDTKNDKIENQSGNGECIADCAGWEPTASHLQMVGSPSAWLESVLRLPH
jgi:hypothetical protein